MIRSERVEQLPDSVVLALTPYSYGEYRVLNELPRADNIQLVYDDNRPLLVFGIQRSNLFGPVDFWFLLCTNFGPKYLRKLKIGMDWLLDQYPHIRTMVESGYCRGEKFAKFLGFVPLGARFRLYGREYQVFEVKR